MAVLKLRSAFAKVVKDPQAKDGHSVEVYDSGKDMLFNTDHLKMVKPDKQQSIYCSELREHLYFNVNTAVTTDGNEFYLYESIDEIAHKWNEALHGRPAAYKKPRSISRQS